MSATARSLETKDVHAAITAANQPFVDRYGATAAQLLLAYLRAFAQRPDVHVYAHNVGAPADAHTLSGLLGRVPAELLALASEVGALEFNWVFDELKDEREDYSPGYNGGRLSLSSVDDFTWWPIPDWRKEYDSFEAQWIFDDFVAEGVAALSYDPDQDPATARLVFDNANDCTRHDLGSIHDYLSAGARAGFTWYWQTGGEGEFTPQLRAASIPRGTRHDVMQGLLEGKGLSAAEATSLLKWLGDDAVVLLHASETAEGRARLERASEFPLADRPSERDMDLELVESLASSGDVVGPDELRALLDAHEQFLATGGAGGFWQLLSVSGLPLCIYQGAQADAGEQFVGRLKNLAGVDASGARLEYADLSGAYGPRMGLAGARLSGSVMTDAIYDGAIFEGTTMRQVDFSGSRLRGASFRNADLTGADFECADLTGADFTGAILDGARFPGAILDSVVR